MDKYVTLPAARDGKPIYGRFGEAFLKSGANRELVKRLVAEIVEPGWKPPLWPAAMKTPASRP